MNAPTAAPKVVKIDNKVSIGHSQKLALIAGPCQIESLDHSLMIAEFLVELSSRYPVNLIFKASFDKANRTSLNGQRGCGIDEGLTILSKIKERLSVPVITDIHSPQQAKLAAQVVDIIQTPAFLCRQTDLLVAAGETGKAVNVKKGQFLPPEDMAHVAGKISSTGNHNILLCERGSCFGYRDLVVDMRGLVSMRKLNYPVIFDGTHSVQSLGGAGGSSGGDRGYVAPLVRAAVAVGIDGIFIECHDAPDRAPSDAKSMLPLSDVESIISTACRIKAAV